MAYNRKNLLQRIIDVQELTLAYKDEGMSQESIYDEIVYPQYRISRRAFYYYLGMNAKRQLKRIKEVEGLQGKLF